MSAIDFDCAACKRNSDRSAWGDGPWRDEPNRIEFEHAGFPCILHRGPSGAWCGYVGLAPGHPFHGKGYSDDEYAISSALSVHGGITYAEKCNGHVCHVAKPGDPDDLWWLGFDCIHCDDRGPAYDMHGHYWTVSEVQEETRRLAEQLAEVSK